MSAPAQRPALGFLRGALIAVVSLVLTPGLRALAGEMGAPGWLPTTLQVLLPVVGFAFGGAVGGAALGVGARGPLGFGCGGATAAVLLLIAAPNLQGLTGFENPWVVVPYAMGSSLIAFGAMGAVASQVLRRGRTFGVTMAFLAGGAAGGLIGVLPFVVQRTGGRLWADVSVFLTMACSIGSVMVPFVVGGASAFRAWVREE